MICLRISGLSLVFSSMSLQNFTRFCFWSSDKILGTILAHIFCIPRSCSKIICTDSLFRLSSCDIICTVNLQSLCTSSFTLVMFSSVLVEGRPVLGSSSTSLWHFLKCFVSFKDLCPRHYIFTINLFKKFKTLSWSLPQFYQKHSQQQGVQTNATQNNKSVTKATNTMLHKSLKHKNGMTYVKLQHNRAKKLCFTVSKWLVDWHCSKSMVDTVQFLFCHTFYLFILLIKISYIYDNLYFITHFRQETRNTMCYQPSCVEPFLQPHLHSCVLANFCHNLLSFSISSSIVV